MFKAHAFCPTCKTWKSVEVTETNTNNGHVAYCSVCDFDYRATFFGDDNVAHLTEGEYMRIATLRKV